MHVTFYNLAREMLSLSLDEIDNKILPGIRKASGL